MIEYEAITEQREFNLISKLVETQKEENADLSYEDIIKKLAKQLELNSKIVQRLHIYFNYEKVLKQKEAELTNKFETEVADTERIAFHDGIIYGSVTLANKLIEYLRSQDEKASNTDIIQKVASILDLDQEVVSQLS